MLIDRVYSKRLYVIVISLLPFVRVMNCSTISIARTATTAVTGKACSVALNGSFLTAPTTATAKSIATGPGSTATTTPAATVPTAMAPIVNCLNGNANGNNNNNNNNNNMNMNMNMHTNATTKAVTKVITTNGIQQVSNGSTPIAAARTITTITGQSKKPELAAKVIQQSHIVCFDVDSTVIVEEGIDELANFCGKGNDVARVTKEAMGGSMTFQEALTIRLNIIRPTQQQISDFIRKHPSTLTCNVKRFIEQLKIDKKQVYLISGGFDCLIEPVAKELGIPMCNVFANKLLFDYNGNYVTFDATQPTSKSGGKAEAISIVKRRYQQNDDSDSSVIITMIGDGATDLEAVPPANYFIGFGGNAVRAEVFKRAQYYVTDFQELI